MTKQFEFPDIHGKCADSRNDGPMGQGGELQNMQYCITDNSLDAIDEYQYMVNTQKATSVGKCKRQFNGLGGWEWQHAGFFGAAAHVEELALQASLLETELLTALFG